jgi:ubiquinone/menaquinone biosynthesis C-methylase UbiE
VVERAYADVETSSDGYARRFAGPVGEWFLARQESCTNELLRGIPARARVLDVGGGHGQLVPLLLARGFDVTIIGSTAACAARLQRWIDRREVTFEAADLLALPAADRSYDVVLSFRLLPHIAEWEQLVAELCRVAARSVIVDYPSTRSVNVFAGRLFGAKKKVEGDTREFTLFEPARVADAFARAGFGVAGECGQFVWPMALHRVAGSVQLSRMLESIPRAVGLTGPFGSPRIVRADRSGSQG